MARKDLPSPNAPNFLARVREEVHALLGKLGSGSDRALTLRDAIESGVIVPGPGGSLIPGPGAGAAEEPDLTPPPQPGAFTATGAISHFLISQAPPFYTQGHGHSRTVVYGAQWVSGPLPVFADAVELDRFAGTVRAVASNPATTWRLWIKWESNDGVLSATPAGGTNGLAVTTGQDVALLLEALASQITSSQLANSLSTPIGQIPSISGIASEALAKANSNLAAIGTIQTKLATLSGTPDYDNAATYVLDDIVKYSGGLYRALGTTTGNLPTNTTYWQKIGDYASLGDAVSAHAAQLSDHETRITDAEGDLTAQASDITQLQAEIGTTNAAVATKASASALSALDTRVTAAEGVNTSQGAAITNLQNSVTTLNDGLATKADATALTALTTRVTAAEGVNTSQGSSITSLQNSVTTVDGLLRVNDTRNDNRDPIWYVTNYPQRSVVEFKSRAVIDAPGTAPYGDLRTTVRWQDFSGGPVTQVFSPGDSLQSYSRFSTSETTWSAWKNDVLDLTTVVGTKANASALNALDTRVTAAEGTISSQGSSITLLQNDLSTLTGTVGTKASASALSALDARVTSAEGVNTSQATAITGLQSSVTTLSNGLATKADASALTTTNTNVSNLSGTVSAQAGQITTLQSSVQNISVGGRNLLPGTDGGAGWTDWYAGNEFRITRASSGEAGYIYSPHVELRPGAEIVISFESKQTGVVGSCDFFILSDNYHLPGGGLLTSSYPLSTEWVRNTVKFTVPVGLIEPMRVRFDHNGGDGSSSTVHVRKVKLEYGNIATDWTAAPEDLTAALQVEATTRATQTGELYAQYTVKTDLGGLVSGYGLASSAVNAAPTSAFGVQAGQFFVAPPAVAAATAPTAGLFKGYAWRDTTANVTKYWTGSAWSTSPQSLPFVVQAVPTTINGFTVEPGIYADNAFFARLVATRGQIGLLAVDDARIASVSVGKLTAGSISVGEYLQSTGYVAGSAGLRLNGDGTAELSQVVVRGTVFASQGAIGGWNVGSNYLQSTTYVLGGIGTRLNSDGTGQIGGVTIYSQGLGAGSTAYNTGDGAWLGRDGKFSLRAASGSSLTFDGSRLKAQNADASRLLDLGATGAESVLKVGAALDIKADGSATFAGALNAASGTFSGTLTADAINAVDTINLAGNAVTIPVSAYTSGNIDTLTAIGWTTVQTVTIYSPGNVPFFITATVDFSPGDGVNGFAGNGIFGVSLDSTSSVLAELISGAASTIALTNTPSEGTHTYRVLAKGQDFATKAKVSQRSIMVLGVKR